MIKTTDQVQELMGRHMFEIHVPAHTRRGLRTEMLFCSGQDCDDRLIRYQDASGQTFAAMYFNFTGALTYFLKQNGRMEEARPEPYWRTLELWQSDHTAQCSYPMSETDPETPVDWKYHPMDPGEIPGYDEMTRLHSWEEPDEWIRQAGTKPERPRMEIKCCRTCAARMTTVPGGPEGRTRVMIELPEKNECYYTADQDGRMVPARDADFYGRESYRYIQFPN